MYKFYVDVLSKPLMIFLQNDLTFATITQGIKVITTKPEIEKHSLIKQFEQPGLYYGMPLMIILKTLIKLNKNIEKHKHSLISTYN